MSCFNASCMWYTEKSWGMSSVLFLLQHQHVWISSLLCFRCFSVSASCFLLQITDNWWSLRCLEKKKMASQTNPLFCPSFGWMEMAPPLSLDLPLLCSTSKQTHSLKKEKINGRCLNKNGAEFCRWCNLIPRVTCSEKRWRFLLHDIQLFPLSLCHDLTTLSPPLFFILNRILNDYFNEEVSIILIFIGIVIHRPCICFMFLLLLWILNSIKERKKRTGCRPLCQCKLIS